MQRDIDLSQQTVPLAICHRSDVTIQNVDPAGRTPCIATAAMKDVDARVLERDIGPAHNVPQLSG